jgi:hypothetical protein
VFSAKLGESTKVTKRHAVLLPRPEQFLPASLPASPASPQARTKPHPFTLFVRVKVYPSWTKPLHGSSTLCRFGANLLIAALPLLTHVAPVVPKQIIKGTCRAVNFPLYSIDRIGLLALSIAKFLKWNPAQLIAPSNHLCRRFLGSIVLHQVFHVGLRSHHIGTRAVNQIPCFLQEICWVEVLPLNWHS